jgi:hypothetical protein
LILRDEMSQARVTIEVDGMNNNGNGHRNRVVADGWKMLGTVAYCFAIAQSGLTIQADRHLVTYDTGADARWSTCWNDLPGDALVIRIVMFREGSGFWQPLRLPRETSDEMVRTTEALLRVHGVNLTAGLGLRNREMKRWGIPAGR